VRPSVKNAVFRRIKSGEKDPPLFYRSGAGQGKSALKIFIGIAQKLPEFI